MAPRIAKSLDVLRSQVNLAFPLRDKSSDGWLGDAAHAARASDHNPDKNGVVRALDITHDPAHGINARAIAQALLDSRDPRILYIISNAEIARSYAKTGTTPWRWSPYTGPNAHRQHFHISVVEDPTKYDDTRSWALPGAVPIPIPKPPPDRRRRMAKAILDYEARRVDGHLVVYILPANDGGGLYEVAGINDKYHPVEAARLKSLLDAGKYVEAEDAAIDFIAQYTDIVANWHVDPGVQFYLRDCCLNRGPTGAARILQRALGSVFEDGQIGPLTLAAAARLDAPTLLNALRAARESYERNPVGRDQYSSLWIGLVNRWNKALAAAHKFSDEMPAVPVKLSWLQALINAIISIFKRR